MSKVHIVLASFNGEKYIRQQLDSILGGDFQDITIEVCDDGSTDGTVGIVKEYEEKYPEKIYLYQNEKNLGYVKNFMYGIKRSKSSYTMLCDQDDIWMEDKISSTLAKMEEIEQEGKDIPILVFADAQNYDVVEEKMLGSFQESSHLKTKNIDLPHLLMENKCIGCTVMINDKVLPFLETLPEEIRVHDWWLALICSAFGKIGYLDRTVLLYCQHGGNMIGGAGFGSYFKNRLKSFSKQRAVLKETFLQGRAFYEMFGEKLELDKRKICEVFAGLSEAGFLKRRTSCIRYRFLKSGLVRNVALMILL